MFVTWIFWIAGAAAITDTLGGGLNCSFVFTVILCGDSSPDVPTLIHRTGITYCEQLNALEAFAWIEVCV